MEERMGPKRTARSSVLHPCMCFSLQSAILKKDCLVLIARFHFDIEMFCLIWLLCRVVTQ